MTEMISGTILFNRLKLKYAYMNEYFNFNLEEKRAFYFFIDFDYLLRIYMHATQYEDFRLIDEEFIDNFTVGLLNFISHYKNYFYKYCDSMSYFYIGVDRKQYKDYPNMTKMFSRLVSTANMIPRINFYYCDSRKQKFYIKYNLIRTIKTLKSDTNVIIMDIGKQYMNELIYYLTKKYYVIRFSNHESTTLYSFDDFKSDCLNHVPDIYINKVIQLLPVYESLEALEIVNEKRIDKVIMDFIIKNKDNDINYNDNMTKELVLKLFTSKRKALNRLREINNNLSNPVYQTMITSIIKGWRNTIKDNSVYKINEMLNIPDKCRINIELLMNY